MHSLYLQSTLWIVDALTNISPGKAQLRKFKALILGETNRAAQHLCDAQAAIIEHAEWLQNAGKPSLCRAMALPGLAVETGST
jgi:hypothetical protein